jgi:hypothetical protein
LALFGPFGGHRWGHQVNPRGFELLHIVYTAIMAVTEHTRRAPWAAADISDGWGQGVGSVLRHLLDGHMSHQVGLRRIRGGGPCGLIVFGRGFHDLDGIPLPPMGSIAAVRISWVLHAVTGNLGWGFGLYGGGAIMVRHHLALFRQDPGQEVIPGQRCGRWVVALLDQSSSHLHGFWQPSLRFS